LNNPQEAPPFELQGEQMPRQGIDTTMVEITPDLLTARTTIETLYLQYEKHRNDCELRYWNDLLANADATKKKEYLSLLYKKRRHNIALLLMQYLTA